MGTGEVLTSANVKAASAKHKIAIFGGSGFVGSALSKFFSTKYDVTALDLVPPREFDGRFEVCDIRRREDVLARLQGFELAINAAIIQLPRINEEKKLALDVNVLGLKNICDAVECVSSMRGLLHASSWHVFGERGLRGTIGEEFGFHPDRIEERARLYALSKIAQESIIRIIAEASSRTFGIVRVGTVLGEDMPAQTAANLFIRKALNNEPMTPFKHTQHRPMLYVDIRDVCVAFEAFASAIFEKGLDTVHLTGRTMNLMSPRPLSIIDLARVIQRTVYRMTSHRIRPKIHVLDKGLAPIYSSADKKLFTADVSVAKRILGISKLTAPQVTIERIIKSRMARSNVGRL